MIIISFNELCETLKNKMIKYNFDHERAERCAALFAENNLYGVASHGTNRFKSFIDLISLGLIDVNASPSKVKSFGAIEQWDGNSGPGPLNALDSVFRAMDLARENGIGCVALKNTNHWMRAGNFGWKAAEKGFVLIAFTNAFPMMPPWGSKEPVVGNNPLCIAVPRKNDHVVLDMAMSQFSYGQLANYRRDKKDLPLDGGYDDTGKLTKNAGQIYDTKRVLPIGFWKGSGLSIMFDLIASLLSGGKATHELNNIGHDTGMSQVFIVIDPRKFASANYIYEVADKIIKSIKNSEPAENADSILYPGERALTLKNEYLENGIPVDEIIWQQILDL